MLCQEEPYLVAMDRPLFNTSVKGTNSIQAYYQSSLSFSYIPHLKPFPNKFG